MKFKISMIIVFINIHYNIQKIFYIKKSPAKKLRIFLFGEFKVKT